MLAKLNVPANSEVGAMAAMVEAARSDIKADWESHFVVTFHIPYTRAGISDYKTASPGRPLRLLTVTFYR